MYRILMVHADYKGHTFVFVKAFMSHKTRALYDAVFLQVKAMLPDSVQPEYLLTDYETALQKGLGTIFPEATVLGCWFHFSQVRVNKFTC